MEVMPPSQRGKDERRIGWKKTIKKTLSFLFQDQDQSWLRTHISWKAYRDLVNDAVMDIALRQLLNGYVPFEKRQRKLNIEDGLEQGPTLEQVCNKIQPSLCSILMNNHSHLQCLKSFAKRE